MKCFPKARTSPVKPILIYEMSEILKSSNTRGERWLKEINEIREAYGCKPR